MSNITIGLIGVALGLSLIALRVQIGVALGVVSFFGIALLPWHRDVGKLCPHIIHGSIWLSGSF